MCNAPAPINPVCLAEDLISSSTGWTHGHHAANAAMLKFLLDTEGTGQTVLITHWHCLSLFLACFFSGMEINGLHEGATLSLRQCENRASSAAQGHQTSVLRSIIKDLHEFVLTLACKIGNPSKKTILYSAWMQCVKYNGAIPLHQGVRCIWRSDFFLGLSHHSDCNQTFQSPNYKTSRKKGKAEDLEWLM